MTTTLCFDFGNTRKKVAIFDKSILREVLLLPDDSEITINDLLKKYKPVKSILSSVIEDNAGIEKILGDNISFHKLSYQSKLPFTTPVSKPETIGSDRLALAAAAVYFHPGKNNLIIGMGSCITYNLVNKYSQFLGGSISPGMEMRFSALSTFTAKLPLVKADWNFPLIGYDTRTNILSGVILGIITEIEGFIDMYSDRYRNFNVVLTGGDAPYFVQHLKYQIFADPDMIFKGLYAISEYNDDAKT